MVRKKSHNSKCLCLVEICLRTLKAKHLIILFLPNIKIIITCIVIHHCKGQFNAVLLILKKLKPDDY